MIKFDWIHPVESLTVIRFSCSENVYEERLQNPAAFLNPVFGQECTQSIISRLFNSFDLKNWLNKSKSSTVDGYLENQWNGSKGPSQSTCHTHRTSGRDEALVRQDLWQITCFLFKNNVCIAAQNSPTTLERRLHGNPVETYKIINDLFFFFFTWSLITLCLLRKRFV